MSTPSVEIPQVRTALRHLLSVVLSPLNLCVCRENCLLVQKARTPDVNTPMKISKRDRVHRLLREWFNAYRQSILAVWVRDTIIRFIQSSPSLSFSTFDWPNHFLHLTIQPSFSRLSAHDGNPSTAFRLRGERMRSFDDLRDEERSVLGLSPFEVQHMQKMAHNVPTANLEEVAGTIMVVFDAGHSVSMRILWPIWKSVAEEGDLPVHPSTPTGFTTMQKLVAKGWDSRVVGDGDREFIHYMMKGEAGWEWTPLTSDGVDPKLCDELGRVVQVRPVLEAQV